MFHSAVICGTELFKRDGVMKMRLATNIEIGTVVRISLLRWC